MYGAAIIASSVAHQPFISKPFSFGFLLKCSASQSPNSRSFDSVFSAQTALNPLSTVLSFMSSTFSNGAHVWLNPHIAFKAWRVETEYPLACSQAAYLSIKPGTIPGAGFYEY